MSRYKDFRIDGPRVLEERLRRGWRLWQLAKRCYCPLREADVACIERGDVEWVDGDVVRALEEALDLPRDTLVLSRLSVLGSVPLHERSDHMMAGC